MDPRQLRRPEEACRRGARSNGMDPGRESDVPTAGPDWERQPVRPAVGVRVAVHGLCKSRLCRLVADMMRVIGEFAVVLGCPGAAVVVYRPTTQSQPLTFTVATRGLGDDEESACPRTYKSMQCRPTPRTSRAAVMPATRRDTSVGLQPSNDVDHKVTQRSNNGLAHR